MSTKLRVYHPQPLYIPENAGIRRRPLTNWGTREEPGDTAVHTQFDARTLFYDMFLLQGDELACIGPPFLNLGPPEQICCEGEKLEFRVENTEIDHLQQTTPCLLFIKLPFQCKTERPQLDLQFRFREFEISSSCRISRAPTALPGKSLGLVTLQKDNPIQWLKDWCTWHHRVHEVQRIVLYDNGSRYFSRLGENLATLGRAPEIILVRWPFIYGPVTHPVNKFCQDGVLNHFRLYFGHSVEWALNLDIDEYLYLDDRRKLTEYLAQPSIASRAVLYLGSFLFPGSHAREKSQPRFFHYSRRYREKYYPQNTFQKYIFRPSKVATCIAHRAYVPARGIQKLKSAWKRRRFRKRAHYWRELHRIACEKNHRLETPPYLYAGKKRIDKRLFFCHFKGLHNGWRKVVHGYVIGSERTRMKHERRLRQRYEDLLEIPPEQLGEDRRVIEQAIRVGLAFGKPVSSGRTIPGGSMKGDQT